MTTKKIQPKSPEQKASKADETRDETRSVGRKNMVRSHGRKSSGIKIGR